MHSAILAGLSILTGDFAVIKMADNQESTSMIFEMINEYKYGAEAVLAIRKDREDNIISKKF